jgi:hypothetical protein
MANCLNTLVGIDGYCDESALAINLNDIGIALSELESLISDDYANGLALFKAKQKIANAKIQSDIVQYLGSKYRASSVIESNYAGVYQQPIKFKAGLGAGNFKGIIIRLQENSSYLSYYFNQATINVAFTGMLDVLVYNVRTGQLLKTLQVATTANEPTNFTLDLKVDANRQQTDIAIVYESIYDYAVTSPTLNYCTGCKGDEPVWCDQYTYAIGVEFDGNKFKSIGDTGGVSVQWSISCDFASWLCSIGHLVRIPLAYKIASEIMEYAYNISPFYRNNSHTVNQVETIQRRYDFYSQQYQIEMEKLLKNMNQNAMAAPCFNCREPLRYAPFAI